MSEAAFVDAAAREWETWPEPQAAERGVVFWKTLVGDGLTRSEGLTLGVASLPPGETLREHRHEQAEVYLVLEGAGVVTVSGEAREVRPGVAVYIPGDALHACANAGPGDLRFAYVLAADSFDDVRYSF